MHVCCSINDGTVFVSYTRSKIVGICRGKEISSGAHMTYEPQLGKLLKLFDCALYKNVNQKHANRHWTRGVEC